MELARAAKTFDHPDWLFELKHDGFRGVAYVEHGKCRLISRGDYLYKRFDGLCTTIVEDLRAKDL